MPHRSHAAYVIPYIVAILTSLALFGGSSYANPNWPRTPTDDEIRKAAENHASACNYPVTLIYEYQTFKVHQSPNGPNEVLLCVRKDDGRSQGSSLAVFYWLDYGCYYNCHETCEPQFGFGGFRPAFPYHWESLGSCAADIDHLFQLAPELARGWLGESPPSENRPPTVRLSYSPANPTPNDTIYFQADASDPDGDILTYRWFLNDVEQTSATAPTVQWSNPTPGTYTIRVIVSDGRGGMAEDSVEFIVQASQPRYVIMPGTGDLEGEEPIAFVNKIEIDGKVTYESKPGTPLYRGAFVKTGSSVEIKVVFNTGAWTRVRENTYFEVRKEEFAKADTVVIYTRLIEGIANFYFPKGAAAERKFEVETNMVVVGIKGTELAVEHTSGVTKVTVIEGEVEVRDKTFGTITTVRAGETARFDGITPPTPPHPPGTKTIEQALDADNNKIIDDFEMLQALQYWIKQQIVPGTNKTIDDLTMLALLQKWIKATPIP